MNPTKKRFLATLALNDLNACNYVLEQQYLDFSPKCVYSVKSLNLASKELGWRVILEAEKNFANYQPESFLQRAHQLSFVITDVSETFVTVQVRER